MCLDEDRPRLEIPDDESLVNSARACPPSQWPFVEANLDRYVDSQQLGSSNLGTRDISHDAQVRRRSFSVDTVEWPVADWFEDGKR